VLECLGITIRRRLLGGALEVHGVEILASFAGSAALAIDLSVRHHTAVRPLDETYGEHCISNRLA
jgi:hypothetical protein